MSQMSLPGLRLAPTELYSALAKRAKLEQDYDTQQAMYERMDQLYLNFTPNDRRRLGLAENEC